MFERYTEKARRVIFFSRYEASDLGSRYIEAEHLLLALFREAPSFLQRFFPNPDDMETIQREIRERGPVGPKVSTSVDLPLSNECKRILVYAAEEADRLANRNIDTQHLFLGVLHEERCLPAELLRAHGVKLPEARQTIHHAFPPEIGQATSGHSRVGPSSGAPSDPIWGAQVGIQKPIEFHNAGNGTVLGSARMSDPPQIGHEIAIANAQARVLRVVHHYRSGAEPQQLMPQKIVVYVEILPD